MTYAASGTMQKHFLLFHYLIRNKSKISEFIASNKGLENFYPVHFLYKNPIFNITTKRTYAIKHMYYYQHSPARFGAYCSTFRDNFII